MDSWLNVIHFLKLGCKGNRSIPLWSPRLQRTPLAYVYMLHCFWILWCLPKSSDSLKVLCKGQACARQVSGLSPLVRESDVEAGSLGTSSRRHLAHHMLFSGASVYLEFASRTVRVPRTLLQLQEQTFKAPNMRKTKIDTITVLHQVTGNFSVRVFGSFC